MECSRIVFSGHALRRMFRRRIASAEVMAVVRTGEVIADYPDDLPYPSCLILGFVRDAPLHVVVAVDKSRETCYIVTTYGPDPAVWEPGYRRRKPR